jgi:hypothetical protein
MNFFAFKNRNVMKRFSKTMHGDEGLVTDLRGDLKPIDCVERKLSSLLNLANPRPRGRVLPR